jgi:hypothetical protein
MKRGHTNLGAPTTWIGWPTAVGGRVSMLMMQSECFLSCKVQTPIHDSIRELVTWECKEHGVRGGLHYGP